MTRCDLPASSTFAITTAVVSLEVAPSIKIADARVEDSWSWGVSVPVDVRRGKGSRWNAPALFFMVEHGDEEKQSTPGAVRVVWTKNAERSGLGAQEAAQALPCSTIAEWNVNADDWRLPAIWYLSPWDEVRAAKRHGEQLVAVINREYAGLVECVGMTPDRGTALMELTVPSAIAPRCDAESARQIAECIMRCVLQNVDA